MKEHVSSAWRICRDWSAESGVDKAPTLAAAMFRCALKATVVDRFWDADVPLVEKLPEPDVILMLLEQRAHLPGVLAAYRGPYFDTLLATATDHTEPVAEVWKQINIRRLDFLDWCRSSGIAPPVFWFSDEAQFQQAPAGKKQRRLDVVIDFVVDMKLNEGDVIALSSWAGLAGEILRREHAHPFIPGDPPTKSALTEYLKNEWRNGHLLTAYREGKITDLSQLSRKGRRPINATKR